MSAAVLACVLFSLVLMALLAACDPKRQRNSSTARLRKQTVRSVGAWRSVLGWLTLSPGVWLAFSGQTWGLLAWAGSLCSLGWVISQVFTWRNAERAGQPAATEAASRHG